MDNELWRRDPNRQYVHFEGASADLSVRLSVFMHEFNSELRFVLPYLQVLVTPVSNIL